MMTFGLEDVDSHEPQDPVTIEDYLDIISANKKILTDPDQKLFYSLHRQSMKGMGLTERQHELLKLKLLEYSEWLEARYPDFREDLDHLRHPYRIIDRTRTIKVIEREVPVFGGLIKAQMMAIRFPFSNKMIKHIDFIKSVQDKKMYDNKTKTHFVKLNERNALDIITHFKDLEFDIEPQLLEYYDEVCQIQSNSDTHCPGVYDYQLRNVHPRVVEYAHEKFGEPGPHNLHLYRDAAGILGLSHFDLKASRENDAKLTQVSQNILLRTTNLCFASSKIYGLDQIFESIHELDRYPLLISMPVLSRHESVSFYQANGIDHVLGPGESVPDIVILAKLHTYLESYVKNSEMAVLYRKDKRSIDDCEFNNYVTRHELNNLPTKDTKVIFLHQQKRIPKPLLESSWRPRTVLMLRASISTNRTITVFRESADLNLTYSDEFFTGHHYFTI